MWPWEHLAVGYVAYSLWRRTVSGSRPETGAVLALAVGTQFPDLVDKPLGWGTTLLPSGTSLAHSIFVALPLAALAIAGAHWYGRRELGTAFAVGYLLHLPADVAYSVLLGGDVSFALMLWPLVSAPSAPPMSVFGRTLALVERFLEILATPAGRRYLLFEGALLVGAFSLWLFDGRPGLEVVRRADARPETR